MNAWVARAAIIFAGLIVAGALMNLYLLGALFTVGMVLAEIGLSTEQVFPLLYWPCLAAGFVSAFVLLRPGWIAAGKNPARKAPAEKAESDQVSD